MKTLFFIPVLTGLLTLQGMAADTPVVLSEQEVRAIGPLPEDKTAETIKKGEYNPFAERQATQITKEDGESEDSKLMTILRRIPLTGIVHDADGRCKVLFGSKLLAEGDRLPKYLENQTSLQRVSKVTDKVVEFSWVEDQAGATPRKVVRKVQINQHLIEQVQNIPGEDGKSAGTMSNWVTSSGDSLHEEAPEAAPEDPKAIPSANNGADSVELNHRPDRSSVNRRTARGR